MKFKNSKNIMSAVITVLAAMMMVMCAATVITYDSEDSDATNYTVAATVGTYFSFNLGVTSTSGSGENFLTSGTLPSGLSYNSSTGYITGTPSVTGTYSFSASVDGFDGSTIYNKVTITVSKSVVTTYTFKLAFNLQGGSGTFSTLTATSTATTHIFTITSGIPTKTGYQFIGWSLSSSATEATYTGNMDITCNPGTTTLYAVWKGTVLNFNSNGGTGSIDKISTYEGDTIILPSSGFTRTGHTLIGWSTVSNNTIADYGLGSQYIYPGTYSSTLYAVWKADTTETTVTYNENGGTLSNNITTSVKVLSGNSYTLLTKGFSKTGYYLSSWNTSANGSGTSYALGKTITMPANDLTLYAQWTVLPSTNDELAPTNATVGVLYSYKPDTDGDNNWWFIKSLITSCTITFASCPSWLTTHDVTRNSIYFSGTPGTDDVGVHTVSLTATYTNGESWSVSWVITVSPANEGVNYTITYNANGGTGTEDTVTGSADTIIILPSYSVAGFSKEGYTLGGWSTTIDGTTVIYPLGSIYTIHSDKIFSAYWVANTHVIVFDVNGGSGENAYQTADTDGLVTLPSEGYTKSGCTLNGWYISSDPTTIYAIGYTYQVSSTTVFKAYWVETGTTTLKVTFNANGGVGGFTMNVESGKKVVMPVYGTTYSGHTLQKWNSAADGNGTEYVMGSSVAITSASTFYAQWIEVTSTTFTVTFNLNGGQGSVAPQVLNSGDTISIPNNPTRYGYIFSYWKDNQNGEWDFTTGVTSDVTLVAQWTQLASLTTNGTTVTVTIGNNYKSGTSTIVWGDSSENSTGVSATFTHDYGLTSSGTISVSVVLSGVTYSTSLLYSVTASESGGSGDGGNEDDNNDGNNEQSNNNWIIFAIVIILLILGMAVIMVII